MYRFRTEYRLESNSALYVYLGRIILHKTKNSLYVMYWMNIDNIHKIRHVLARAAPLCSGVFTKACRKQKQRKYYSSRRQESSEDSFLYKILNKTYFDNGCVQPNLCLIVENIKNITRQNCRGLTSQIKYLNFNVVN